MSDDEKKLQQQIADIGTRYLKRTLDEIAQLRAYLEDARKGSPEAMKQLERMAHKIHGSGAMFGFDEVSECADGLERLAATGGGDAEFLQRVDAGVSALEAQVNKEAQARGLL